MSEKLTHFLFYNNTVPVLLGVLFLSSGVVLAANPDVRETLADSVVDAEARVIAVDNTYLLDLDLSTYQPAVQVTNVEEDETYYYVTYVLETVSIRDSVWQPVEKEVVLTVEKGALAGSDLGLYVTKELRQVVARELALLGETQEIEQNIGRSEKVVATAYSGLVGRFLDVKEERFPGYSPVIEPDDVVVPRQAPPPSRPTQDTDTQEGGSLPVDTPTDAEPRIQILGANPLTVSVGGTYTELGAVVTDDRDDSIELTMTGEVDITTPGEYYISYSATDSADNTTVVRRLVRVEAPGGSSGGSSSGGDDDDSGTTTPPEPEEDVTPPVVTLNGQGTVELIVGDEYTELGATALDDVDGDISDAVVVTGSVNTATTGVYTLIYIAVDTAGNEGSEERVVTVVGPEPVTPEPPAPEPPAPQSTTSDPEPPDPEPPTPNEEPPAPEPPAPQSTTSDPEQVD